MYTVYNTYGIRGETNHRKFEAAVKARARCEGVGWVIYDESRQARVEPLPTPREGGGWDLIPRIV